LFRKLFGPKWSCIKWAPGEEQVQRVRLVVRDRRRGDGRVVRPEGVRGHHVEAGKKPNVHDVKPISVIFFLIFSAGICKQAPRIFGCRGVCNV
jgi:hypothetical protein